MTVLVRENGEIVCKSPHDSHTFVNTASLPSTTIWECMKCGLGGWEQESLLPCSEVHADVPHIVQAITT